MTGTALHSKPFSRQCTSTKNTLMAVYTSVNKHSRCMIRLLYCILLFSPCSRASLLKASVGNMTHMALSVIPTSSCCVFMIRLIPKIQLSPPPPTSWRPVGVKLILQRQTVMGWSVKRQVDTTWQNRSDGRQFRVNSTDLRWDGNWHSSCYVGILATRGVDTGFLTHSPQHSQHHLLLISSRHCLNLGLRTLSTVQLYLVL